MWLTTLRKGLMLMWIRRRCLETQKWWRLDKSPQSALLRNKNWAPHLLLQPSLSTMWRRVAWTESLSTMRTRGDRRSAQQMCLRRDHLLAWARKKKTSCRCRTSYPRFLRRQSALRWIRSKHPLTKGRIPVRNWSKCQYFLIEFNTPILHRPFGKPTTPKS